MKYFALLIKNRFDIESIKTIETILNDYEITDLSLPAWLPEDLVYKNVEITGTPQYINILFLFNSETSELSFLIRKYYNNTPNYSAYETTEYSTERINRNGHDYYVNGNDIYRRVTWIENQNECSITSNLSLKEIYSIIDSIKERG